MLTQNPPTSGEVGTFYNRHTDVYDHALGGNIHVGYWDDEADDSPMHVATDRLTDLVAERLAPEDGQHLLDVGCGHGSTAMRIVAHHAVRITGVSVSDYQVELANSRPLPPDLRGQTTFQLADAMELPFPDASFDGAYAIESLMHMKDKVAAIGHIARVLRPGGRLVIAEHSLEGELTAPDTARMADAYAFFKFSLSTDGYRTLLREAGTGGGGLHGHHRERPALLRQHDRRLAEGGTRARRPGGARNGNRGRPRRVVLRCGPPAAVRTPDRRSPLSPDRRLRGRTPMSSLSSRNRCPYRLDGGAADIHGEAAALRALGPATRVELPGGVPAWSVTDPGLVRRLLIHPPASPRTPTGTGPPS
ncbi:hypothetical protein GCM10020254_80810 [Streptomyces goshikiensis]